MPRISIPLSIIALLVITSLVPVPPALAGSPHPEAPASMSWIPHGYGGNMWVDNTFHTREKGYYGFRTVPMHTGAWSQPLYGWDVNGFYLGPQVPDIDPVTCQLPIGLIYPENGPMLPPRGMRPGQGIHK
jgi:hypothetical protein